MERVRPSVGDDSPGAAADLVAAVLLLGLAAFVVVEAVRMPPRGPLGFLTGPGLVPLVLGAALGGMSAILLAGALRRGAGQALPQWAGTLRTPEASRLLAIMAITGLLAVLIGRVPFWAANLAYFLMMFAYLRVGGGRIGPLLLYAAGLAFFVGVLLPRAFELTMP